MVDIIACEDTRTSLKLLNHYWIKKPLISFHSHSWKFKLDSIIEKLKNGLNIGLISDAWTPGISDPWYILIKEAIINNIQLIPIPWVTAFTTALMVSWMQMNHFLYLWFLPIKKWRQTLFKKLVDRKKNKKENETVIIYESVHRIVKTLEEIKFYFWWEHQTVVARELTKKFEEVKRWNIDEIIAYYQLNKENIKWEFVILF